MKKILVIGAGLSSHYLIEYLAQNSLLYNWGLTVADTDENQVKRKISSYPHVKSLALDIEDTLNTAQALKEFDVVVSLVPAFLQIKVAQYCLELGKHLLTASYLPAEIKAMESAVKAKKLVFFNELGLDPGIDHLSAMKMIDEVKAEGGIIKAFRSYCGALIAPQSNTNPWHYKFTWNPRNVVLAGQGGTAKFIENGKYRYIPYNQLFRQIETIEVEGLGKFEAYANRDSLGYRSAYGLDDVPTLLRGTLRYPTYCAAWDIFVQLGMTDSQLVIENSDEMTYREWFESFIYHSNEDIWTRLEKMLGRKINEDDLLKINYLGLLENKKIGLKNATSAQILQDLLAEKWQLSSQDKDMIVMQHQLEFEKSGKKYQWIAEMSVIGENSQLTAIAKTVGLPLAMATKLILNGDFNQFGVFIPTMSEVYLPILNELNEWGVSFNERKISL
jgi:saccharopine dehydrogenase-like NADP-dependent oxidoreductase